jgi:hypothetical protein
MRNLSLLAIFCNLASGYAEVLYNLDAWNLFSAGADDAAIMNTVLTLKTNGVNTVMLSPNVGETFICAPGVYLEMCHGGIAPGDKEIASLVSQCWGEGQNTVRWAANVVRRWSTQRVDPFGIAITNARSAGLRVFISFRMCDTHAVVAGTCTNPAYSDAFWTNHAYFRTSAGTYDFSNAEVRQYRVDQIHELLTRYGVDGVELDFLRGFPYFKDRDAASYTEIMDRFVNQIASVVVGLNASNNQQMKVYVRVPFSIAECKQLGLDPPAWARKGWIQAITLGRWLRLTPDVEDFASAAPQVPIYLSTERYIGLQTSKP